MFILFGSVLSDEVRQQLRVEVPPLVLVLHLKRWGWANSRGASKLTRPLQFGTTLSLPRSLFPGSARGDSTGRDYRLMAVIAHIGACHFNFSLSHVRRETVGKHRIERNDF